ncbi:MAG: class II aldolase/adducin family protein [Candidatus Eremiobacteraeota bacterium]|nr:class II aldolase/adducin family protein [Candidatus Eremiobacteraeota bacterium]
MHEAEAREAIVAYSRALWERRLVTGTSGNISVRLADGDILATPAARSLRNLYAAEIVRADERGAPRDPKQKVTSEFPLHAATYAARPDANALIHTHPTFCVVWSTFGEVFPRDTVGARETLGDVAWTAYRPPGSEDLARLAAEQFARGINTVLMERHGISAIGTDLETAFVLTDLAEEAARIAYFGRLGRSGSKF